MVRNLGAELMAACGEPDKPVTKKSIDEVINDIRTSPLKRREHKSLYSSTPDRQPKMTDTLLIDILLTCIRIYVMMVNHI